MTRRDALLLALLAGLPVAAHAPAWAERRLLGPGDGAALHFPLRAEVWRAYARGELPSWNPGVFSGTPLLAAYRPGPFYPPMAALALLPPFPAFQVLVLASLAAASALTYVYLRRLGANRVGAYVAGLAFALGPYLVGHLGDTATVVAAPLLPLLLLAAEAHLAQATAFAAAGLSLAVALLLVAGSEAAVVAGTVLVVGRLGLAHLTRATSVRAGASLVAVSAGVLVAAPQLLPTFLAWRAAGPGGEGFAAPGAMLPGVTGLVVRYVSHTPGPALALAALPLVITHAWVRRAAGALALGLALLGATRRLGDPGAGALLADFSLAVLLGLSLSHQWADRRGPLGRRLRAWFLLACLASAAALAVAAGVTGPLPQALTGAVGVLALALVLYFTLAEAHDPVAAHAFVIPLTVAFLLQPHAREAWAMAPTETELMEPTPTREAIDRAMGRRREERTLSLVPAWPRSAEADLAYANRGGFLGRRNAEGYDPLVSRERLALYDGMSVAGALPASFFRTDPARLDLLGIRFVQVPTSLLVASPDPGGLGEEIDLVLEAARVRFFALPITRATEVRLVSSLASAIDVPRGTPVVWVAVRLASGREIDLPVRAGVETAERGHHCLATLRLPGRFAIDGVGFHAVPGTPPLSLLRLGVADAVTGRTVGVSRLAAYVSDTVRLQEIAATPNVRLFEVLRGVGRAWVTDSLRRVPDEAGLARLLRDPTRGGIDARRQALALAADVEGVEVPSGSRSSRAEVAREEGGRLELRAEGPGLLVATEGFDPGWTGEVDGRTVRLFRVNGGFLGLVLAEGTHRVVLRHEARGFREGTLLAGLAALGLAGSLLSERRI